MQRLCESAFYCYNKTPEEINFKRGKFIFNISKVSVHDWLALSYGVNLECPPKVELWKVDYECLTHQ